MFRALAPRPCGRRLGGLSLLAALAMIAPTAVTGCGGSQTPAQSAGGGPVADSNVPAPPSVDRSKCNDKGKQVITADTNQDKKPDVWKFFASVSQGGETVQVLACKQVDLNHDGKVDIVYYYDDRGIQTTLEEFDLDFDSRFDLTVYYVTGKKVREELDTNYDQRSDLWKYYEDEKLVRIERDSNGDGKVDEWQYFEGGKLDRIGYDTTGLGRVDRWDRAPETDEAPGGAPAAPAPGGTAPSAPKAPQSAAPTAPPTAATPPPPAPATAPPAAGGATAAKK